MAKEKLFPALRIGGENPTMKVRETPILKRDFNRFKKKHYDVTKLKKVVSLIVTQEKSCCSEDTKIIH